MYTYTDCLLLTALSRVMADITRDVEEETRVSLAEKDNVELFVAKTVTGIPIYCRDETLLFYDSKES